jgi:hypothetical protein
MTMLRLYISRRWAPFFEAVFRMLGLAMALFGSAVLTVCPIDRTIA